ncbi:MAG: hypothetical protein H7249_19175 [Chitinophagaceae bacterium]|nr:hypothetical protein [Oligoflexus sp.]
MKHLVQHLSLTISLLILDQKAFSQTLLSPGVSEISDLPLSQVRLGQGFNSLGGLKHSQTLSDCAATGPLRTFANNSSDSITIYVDNLESESEFLNTITKNQSADLKYAPLGAGASKLGGLSASIEGHKTDLQSIHYNEKFNSVYIEIRRTFGIETLADFDVAPKAMRYFNENPSEFYGKCGDSFVSGYRKGAEVVGVLQCQAKSVEDKKRIDSVVKANAGYKGVSAQGEISSLIETVQKSSNQECRLTFSAQGGHTSTLQSGADKFLMNAFAYINDASDDTAKPLEFVTNSYNVILNSDFSTNVLDKIDLKMTEQKAYVSNLSQDLQRFNEMALLALEQGSAGRASYDLLLQSIAAMEAKKERCILNASDPTFCRDINTYVRLPPGVRLRPTRG